MLVSELITAVKLKGQLQDNQTVISNQEIVDLANYELRTVIVPKILSVREDYFSCQKDYTLSARRRYRLPSRMIGGRITLAKIIDNSTGEEYILPQTSRNVQTSGPLGYYLTEGDIVITGTVPSGIMRLFYPCMPPLMSASDVTTYVVSSVGSTSIQTGAGNGSWEVIRSSSPYRTVTPDLTVSGGVGTNDDSSDYEIFQVDDIVIPVNQTEIVPLEDSLCDWLTQRAVMRYYEALGFRDEMELAGSKLSDMERDILASMSPRTTDVAKIVHGKEIIGWVE